MEKKPNTKYILIGCGALVLITIIGFIVLLLFGAVFFFSGESEEVEIIEEESEEVEEINEPNKLEEFEEKSEEVEEIEKKSEEIHHDEQFEFGEFTVKNIRTRVDDDEVTIKFEWINQSGEDEMPFTGVGWMDVLQGDEVLEEISDAYNPMTNSSILRRTNHTLSTIVTTKYKMDNHEPITIRFGATHEYDDTKEEIVLEL